MSRRAVPKIGVLLFLPALLVKFFGARILQQSFVLGTANCREKMRLGKIKRKASMQTSVFDALLEELADEQDAGKKDLLKRLIKAEREKEQIPSESEVKDKDLVILQKDLDAKTMELLSLKGGLTARSLLEHYANKVRRETGKQDSLRAILRNVDQLQNKSDTAANMSQIVEQCSPENANFCGRFLADLYSQLSGRVHNPRWSGPDIKVTRFLNESQRCVVIKLAEKGDLDVVFDGYDLENPDGENAGDQQFEFECPYAFPCTDSLAGCQSNLKGEKTVRK
jgi:hypothetical protein